MYNEKIEELIKAALADGKITEKEKQVLFKRAQAEGVDLDEFEMVLDARLVEYQKKVSDLADKSTTKSDKSTSVRKCPTCGATVPAFQLTCPDCGFKFEEFNTNGATKMLQERIDNLKNEIENQISELLRQKKALSEDYENKKKTIRDNYKQKELNLSNSDNNNSGNQGFFSSIVSGFNERRRKDQMDKQMRKELNETAESLLIQDISKRIDELNASAEQRVNSIISGFPIPTNKADLFEFITAMSAHLKSNEIDYILNEWREQTNAKILELNNIAEKSNKLELREETIPDLELSVYAIKYKETLIKIQTLFAEDELFYDLMKDIKSRQARLKQQEEEHIKRLQHTIDHLNLKIRIKNIWSIAWKVILAVLVLVIIISLIF